MMAGLCLTVFTLVMGRKEQEEEDINLYNSVLWGPVLMGLGCLMFVVAAVLCGREVSRNSSKQRVGFTKEKEIQKMKEQEGFIDEKGTLGGGLAVIY